MQNNVYLDISESYASLILYYPHCLDYEEFTLNKLGQYMRIGLFISIQAVFKKNNQFFIIFHLFFIVHNIIIITYIKFVWSGIIF